MDAVQETKLLLAVHGLVDRVEGLEDALQVAVQIIGKRLDGHDLDVAALNLFQGADSHALDDLAQMVQEHNQDRLKAREALQERVRVLESKTLVQGAAQVAGLASQTLARQGQTNEAVRSLFRAGSLAQEFEDSRYERIKADRESYDAANRADFS